MYLTTRGPNDHKIPATKLLELQFLDFLIQASEKISSKNL
tara:strand:- start:85 stop:204 length:120 start_codon:yes stop_codon:yes gene_type:complete